MARRLLSRFLVRRLLLLAALGVGLGHLEAVAVTYVRRLLGWAPPFPDVSPEDLARMPGWLIHAEQTREVAATIAVLAIACLVGRNFLEKVAAFLLALGVRQIAYYVALRAMVDWPGSLQATDCLFLVPRSLVGPVWIPVLVAVTTIVAGLGIMLAINRYSAWSVRES